MDGQPVAKQQLAYVLLNKPAGVVTTASDPQRRPTVVSLVEHESRVVPVGRLDVDTTGALLLTNDGPLAHRLAHPRYGVEKVYEVETWKEPNDDALRRLAVGVELEDGVTSPARVRRLGAGRFELVLHEGKNRQVRRMCEAVGHRVRRLHRSVYAGLRRRRPRSRRVARADTRRGRAARKAGPVRRAAAVVVLALAGCGGGAESEDDGRAALAVAIETNGALSLETFTVDGGRLTPGKLGEARVYTRAGDVEQEKGISFEEVYIEEPGKAPRRLTNDRRFDHSAALLRDGRVAFVSCPLPSGTTVPNCNFDAIEPASGERQTIAGKLGVEQLRRTGPPRS